MRSLVIEHVGLTNFTFFFWLSNMNSILAGYILVLIFLLSPCLNANEAPWVGHSLEGIPCSGNRQGVGPYDYTNAADRKAKLEIVESYHFTPNVEQLISGLSTIELGGDIDYTLRAFPNHHRALQAMARYQIQKKRDRNAPYSPAECYFERAINFNGIDATAPILYGIYLHKLGKHKAALKHYKSAEKLDANGTELHYNLGLLYIDLKQYENARRYAIKAYKAGYPLQGLKSKLKGLGLWKPSSR